MKAKHTFHLKEEEDVAARALMLATGKSLKQLTLEGLCEYVLKNRKAVGAKLAVPVDTLLELLGGNKGAVAKLPVGGSGGRGVSRYSKKGEQDG